MDFEPLEIFSSWPGFEHSHTEQSELQLPGHRSMHAIIGDGPVMYDGIFSKWWD